MQRKEIGGMACLVLTAMIWGFAFVSQVQGMASMSPPVLRGHTIHIGRAVINTVAVVPPSRHRRTGTPTP